MDDRELLRYRAASLHYRDGETMEAVGHRLGLSRSTVSRLLKDARDAGLVRITLVEPPAQGAEASLLESRFGLRVRVVGANAELPEVSRLERVARTAAQVLNEWLHRAKRPRVGLAWGTTVNAVVSHLDPVPCHAEVVQVNGAGNPSTTGLPYSGAILAAAAHAWSGQVVHFPVPAFFDYAETKDAMWRERSVRRVLDAQDALDIAVFGVGAFGGPVRSHVYSGGYLADAEIAGLLRDGVVGDVCTVMLRADGSHRGVPLNARASGMDPDRLRRIPRRLCVAAGTAKADGVLAALRAGVATDLVLDSDLARVLTRRLAAEGGLP